MAKILTVDDEPLTRKQLKTVLQKYGHEVYSVSEGEEALKLVAYKRFDLALVDYNLPVIDGLEVLQKLREIQPGCVRILTTDMLHTDLATKAINRGEITHFFEKPFKYEVLMGVITEILETRMRMIEIARVQQEASRDEEKRILDECLHKDFIHIALQPMIGKTEEQKGKVEAFEALLRSSHLILDAPLSIVRAAERHNRLGCLSKIVFERVREWFESLPLNAKIFVNIHPRELANGQAFCERLSVLQPWADRTIIEITERARVQSIDSWEETLSEVVNMGFTIAVDDLGAGHSSLRILADLQPKYIKMDMAVIRNIHEEPRKQRLVDLLSKFAVATDSLLITEGIELEEEMREVLRCGANLLQGFYFAKPLSDIDAVQDILSQQWELA